MKIKEILPINFLFHRAELKVADLPSMIPVAKLLFSEAVACDLHVTGPIHWHYFGFTGDFSKSFILEVALPVGAIPADYDGAFHFKRTETVRAVVARHEGDWMELPKLYTAMAAFVGEHQLQPLGAAREVYINSDFQNPNANSTEVQMLISF